LVRARLVWFVVGAAALLRLALATVVPLTDTTEARFGEMARKMVESGDWLVPLHDYGVPYLAKPPLAFWLSAAGVEVFGAGELGPRIAIFVATCAFLVWLHGRVRVWLGGAAAATSVLFFVAAAAVMTDMLLTIAVTVALAAFWERYRGGSATDEITFYVALGLGLLIKGPLAVVLVLAPLAVWAVAFGHVRAVWRRFSWIRGGLLALAIALPWYVAAELRNPGFLRYFIVGEHLSRFLVPGWSGDLYGRAHDVPRGTVLLFFVIGLLPWSLVLGPMLWRARERVAAQWRSEREFAAFWLTAAAAPLLLFAFAGNVILPYALPGMPAAVIVLAALLGGHSAALERPRLAIAGAVTVAVVGLAVALSLPFIGAHSQRSVLEDISARQPNASVYYWGQRYFSADYYGRGRVVVLHDEASLAAVVDSGSPFELVVATRRLDTLPRQLLPRLHAVSEVGAMSVLERAPGTGAGT
jgi:4-amino-4-deoxy-L-arabinose transferase-like glycosyltransferase